MLGCGAPVQKKSPVPQVVAPTVADGPIVFGIDPVETAFQIAKPNPTFATLPEGRVLTDFENAASFNNFDEFTVSKRDVWKKVGAYKTRPFTVEVGGLVDHPKTYDIDDLLRAMPHEERIYRFRCVEAWSMVLPWTGFPLSALIAAVSPKPEAKYVRFWTFTDVEQMPGVFNAPHYPWPYFEALRLDEAMNELTLLATGMYGKPLPRQNGAPIRLVVPWKYGYKSIKAVTKIEFVAEKPTTFWSTLAPDEYSFVSNVEPDVPHPRWSQATERDLQTDERVPTLPYNGYEPFVAGLYKPTNE